MTNQLKKNLTHNIWGLLKMETLEFNDEKYYTKVRIGNGIIQIIQKSKQEFQVTKTESVCITKEEFDLISKKYEDIIDAFEDGKKVGYDERIMDEQGVD